MTPAKTSKWCNRTVLGIGLASLFSDWSHEHQHGMAFGTLATVNGLGDFLSSVIVGLLWTTFGIGIAFGYSAVLFLCGALLVWHLPPYST